MKVKPKIKVVHKFKILLTPRNKDELQKPAKMYVPTLPEFLKRH
jgi:hypothetical protein